MGQDKEKSWRESWAEGMAPIVGLDKTEMMKSKAGRRWVERYGAYRENPIPTLKKRIERKEKLIARYEKLLEKHRKSLNRLKKLLETGQLKHKGA